MWFNLNGLVFTVDILVAAGKSQAQLITLMMAPLYFNNPVACPVTKNAQNQGPGSGTCPWKTVIMNVIH